MLAGLAFEDRNRIKELEAKLAEVSSNLDHAVHQIEMLNGKLARALEALKAACDDLEVRVQHEWGWPDVHPANWRKFRRDMTELEEWRAALTDTPPTD